MMAKRDTSATTVSREDALARLAELKAKRHEAREQKFGWLYARLPWLAPVLAVVIAPVGLVLGYVMRHRLSTGAMERTRRRVGWTWFSLIVGWILTVVMLCLVLTQVAYHQQLDQDKQNAAQQQQVAQDKQKIRDEALANTPSRGKVDKAFCTQVDALLKVAPQTGIVVSADEINDSRLKIYDTMATTKTPNQQVYKTYAAYLRDGFLLDDSEARAKNSQSAAKALSDDSAACLGVE